MSRKTKDCRPSGQLFAASSLKDLSKRMLNEYSTWKSGIEECIKRNNSSEVISLRNYLIDFMSVCSCIKENIDDSHTPDAAEVEEDEKIHYQDIMALYVSHYMDAVILSTDLTTKKKNSRITTVSYMMLGNWPERIVKALLNTRMLTKDNVADFFTVYVRVMKESISDVKCNHYVRLALLAKRWETSDTVDKAMVWQSFADICIPKRLRIYLKKNLKKKLHLKKNMRDSEVKEKIFENLDEECQMILLKRMNKIVSKAVDGILKVKEATNEAPMVYFFDVESKWAGGTVGNNSNEDIEAERLNSELDKQIKESDLPNAQKLDSACKQMIKITTHDELLQGSRIDENTDSEIESDDGSSKLSVTVEKSRADQSNQPNREKPKMPEETEKFNNAEQCNEFNKGKKRKLPSESKQKSAENKSKKTNKRSKSATVKKVKFVAKRRKSERPVIPKKKKLANRQLSPWCFPADDGLTQVTDKQTQITELHQNMGEPEEECVKSQPSTSNKKRKSSMRSLIVANLETSTPVNGQRISRPVEATENAPNSSGNPSDEVASEDLLYTVDQLCKDSSKTVKQKSASRCKSLMSPDCTHSDSSASEQATCPETIPEKTPETVLSTQQLLVPLLKLHHADIITGDYSPPNVFVTPNDCATPNNSALYISAEHQKNGSSYSEKETLPIESISESDNSFKIMQKPVKHTYDKTKPHTKDKCKISAVGTEHGTESQSTPDALKVRTPVLNLTKLLKAAKPGKSSEKMNLRSRTVNKETPSENVKKTLGRTPRKPTKGGKSKSVSELSSELPASGVRGRARVSQRRATLRLQK